MFGDTHHPLGYMAVYWVTVTIIFGVSMQPAGPGRCGLCLGVELPASPAILRA